jgi:hypothetical protein
MNVGQAPQQIFAPKTGAEEVFGISPKEDEKVSFESIFSGPPFEEVFGTATEKNYEKIFEPGPTQNLEDIFGGVPAAKPTVKQQMVDKIQHPVPGTKDEAVDEVYAIASSTHLSVPEKAKRIVENLAERLDPESRTVGEQVSGWFKDNWRALLWRVASGSALSLAMVLGYIYVGGGDWMTMLNFLREMGTTVVPGALVAALKSAGIAATSAMGIEGVLLLAKTNPKAREVLNKKIPTEFLEPALRRLGVTDPLELTTEKILRFGLQTGTTLPTSGWQGYLMTTGISYTFWAGKMAGKKAVNYAKGLATNLTTKSQEVRDATVDAVLNGTPHPSKTVTEHIVHTIDAAETKIEKEMREEEERPGLPPSISLEIPVRREEEGKIRREEEEKAKAKQKTTTPLTKKTLETNRKWGYVAAASLGLVALALGGNAAGLTTAMKEQFGQAIMPAMKDIAQKGFNIARESTLVKTALSRFLLDKVGVNNLIDHFADVLTPEQEREVRSLAAAIKQERNKEKTQSLSNRLFTTLASGGRKIYSAKELKALSTKEIRGLYQQQFPNQPTGRLSKEAMAVALLNNQKMRLNKLNMLLSKGLSLSMKTFAATAVGEAATKGLKLADTLIMDAKEAQKVLDAEIAANNKDMLEEMERRKKAFVMRDEPDLTADQKAEIEAARRAAAKMDAIKKIADARAAKEAERALVKKLHEEALDRAKERITNRMKTAIDPVNDLWVGPDGTAHPLPSNQDLLSEDLQEALDFEMTPLFDYLAKQGIKKSTSWIPGVGWAQSMIDNANVALNIAETTKNVAKIANVLVKVEKGAPVINQEYFGTLDKYMGFRLPSLTEQAVDNLIKTTKYNVKDLALHMFKVGVVEGWDQKRVAYEVGKKLLGPGEDFGINTEIGSSILNKLFG